MGFACLVVAVLTGVPKGGNALAVRGKKAAFKPAGFYPLW